MIAWFNGDLLPIGGVSIAATDRGFLLGDGFFETMAVNNGKVAYFREHMARLHATADRLSLPVPYSKKEIKKAIKDVLAGCELKNCRAALRLTVTRGSGPRGLMPPLELNPQFLITACEIPDHFSSAKVKTVSVPRNEFSPTSTIKSLGYLDNIIAFEEAHQQGADEGLMLNTAGNIAEGTVSNVFFMRSTTLLTPKIEDGCLPGVMRDAVLKMAPRMGLSVSEETLPPDIIDTCDEAFLTNSLVRIRTIHELNGRVMPSETWTDRILESLKAEE